MKVHIFTKELIRLVAQIEITLLLKIQWKQHHILYVKIVYKQNMTLSKSTLKGGGVREEIKDRLRIEVEIE